MTRINIFPVVLWLTILTKTTLQIAVSVSCSSNAIDLTFAFDEPFIGKIVTRPKRECSAVGKGTSRLKVTIELDAQTRNRCSIVEHENEYVGIIDVQMHRSLSLSEDTSYLVRCPKNNPNKNEHLRKPQVFGAPTAKLTVFDKNKTAHTVKAGKQYDLKLVTTNQESVNSPVEMKQCVAFTGNSELQLIQLTDNNGCPTAEGLKYGFQANDNIDLKTRIKMFDPGTSSTVYLQCKLKKCDPLCQKTNCSPNKDLTEITKPENTDYEGALTSLRLDVQPTPPVPLCMISGLSRAIIYCGVLFLTVMCVVTWTFAARQAYKILSNHFEFPSMHDFTDGVDVVRRFFKRQLNRLKPDLVGLTSAVTSAFGYHHRESSATTFGGNYDYVASRQVKTDIEIPPAPPVAPMRMSVLNLVTHADQSSDVQQQMNGGSPLSMDETNDQEQLNELELFPEPPSISVHDIEKVFKNIIPSENSADETELSISSGEDVLQRECINQDDGFKDDSSTLDRPIGKRKAIYLKRVETLDVDGSTKPVSQTSLPQNRHHSSRRPHIKLNVDESRLRESLRLLKTEVTSNSSIERPRSTGTSYHFLSLIQK